MTTATEFRVMATSLNLRSRPVVRPSTRRATLPQGHRLTRTGDASDPAWWRVETRLHGSPLRGVVAHRFLAPVEEAPAPLPEPAGAVAAPGPHLRENRRDIARGLDGGRAFPLGEAERPRRSAGDAAAKARQLGEIVAWLRVERSPRYARDGSTTYCNVYAYDYCYLGAAYLPRVWWTATALRTLAEGGTVEVAYGTTVHEVNANGLYDWLEEHGTGFGWERVFEPGAAQDAANDGQVALVCAQRTNRNASGHIAAIVPERGEQAAERSGGAVRRPLQSQAGARNFRYGTPLWWTATKFRAFGFWTHA